MELTRTQMAFLKTLYFAHRREPDTEFISWRSKFMDFRSNTLDVLVRLGFVARQTKMYWSAVKLTALGWEVTQKLFSEEYEKDRAKESAAAAASEALIQQHAAHLQGVTQITVDDDGDYRATVGTDIFVLVEQGESSSVTVKRYLGGLSPESLAQLINDLQTAHVLCQRLEKAVGNK